MKEIRELEEKKINLKSIELTNAYESMIIEVISIPSKIDIMELTYKDVKDIYSKVELDIDNEVMELTPDIYSSTIVRTPKGENLIFHFDEEEEKLYNYIMEFYAIGDSKTDYITNGNQEYKCKLTGKIVGDNWYENAKENEGFTFFKLNKLKKDYEEAMAKLEFLHSLGEEDQEEFLENEDLGY